MDESLQDSVSSTLTETTSVSKERQMCYIDYGFCSNMNTSRSGQENGVAAPRFKEESKKNHIAKCFIVGSMIAKNISIPWFSDDTMRPYVDLNHPDRHSKFSNRIDPNNIIEAMRLHRSSKKTDSSVIQIPITQPKKQCQYVLVSTNTWEIRELELPFTVGRALTAI